MSAGSLGSPGFRALQPADRGRVESIVRSGGTFASAEADVALELFDLGVAAVGSAPLDPDYRWTGAILAGDLAGVACFGPTPATDGTFDVYWLAVDPRYQGRGVGRALLSSVEGQVATSGGRFLVVETSSLHSYAGARAFYLARGYRLLATIRDYYREGDSRLILGRRARESPLAAARTRP